MSRAETDEYSSGVWGGAHADMTSAEVLYPGNPSAIRPGSMADAPETAGKPSGRAGKPPRHPGVHPISGGADLSGASSSGPQTLPSSTRSV